MDRNLKREKEDIRVSLLLLLLYISFRPNILVHKTNIGNDLTCEMNYIIKENSISGDRSLTKSFVVN